MVEDERSDADTKGTRAEQVMKAEQSLFQLYADPALDKKPEELSLRGGSFYSEVAVELINALHNNLGVEIVVNTANNGAIQGLPDDAVIETNCLIDTLDAHLLAFGKLPPLMNGLTQQVKDVERLTIEAAVHGDKQKGLPALVANPLVADVNLASVLPEEVLSINKAWLSQFKG